MNDTLRILIDSLLVKQTSTETSPFALFLMYGGLPVVGTLIGTLVGFWLNSYLNQSNFKNEYYKRLIDKRFDAYGKVEIVIKELRFVNVYHNKPFHNVFTDMPTYDVFYNNLKTAASEAIWLTYKLYSKITELNDFLFEHTSKRKDIPSLPTVGMEIYDKLDKDRDEIQDLLFKDLADLYNYRQFLKEHRT